MKKTKRFWALILTAVMALNVLFSGGPVSAAEDVPARLEVEKTGNTVTLKLITEEALPDLGMLQVNGDKFIYDSDVFTLDLDSITDDYRQLDTEILEDGTIVAYGTANVPAGGTIFTLTLSVDPEAYQAGAVYEFTMTFKKVGDANANQYSWSKATLTVSLHEHAYGEPEWEWTADYSSAIASFVCVGEDDTQIVTDNEIAMTEVTPATCTGNKVVKYTAEVTFEGETYTDTKDNVEVADSALGHDWELTGWQWAADYSSATATFTCKNNSEHVETKVDSAPVEVQVSAADCENDKVVKYTAKVTFEGKEYNTTSENVTIENTALGHDWGTPSYVWNKTAEPWTCTATRVCSRNQSHTETETATAELVVITPATTMEEGSGEWRAAFNNEAFKAQAEPVTIPKIPGWQINLTNKTTTATASLDAEMLYANGEVTFTVSNSVTMDVFPEPIDAGCVVAVANSDGTYTALPCTTADGTHSFTVTMNGADIDLVLVLRGDANLDGEIDVIDLSFMKQHMTHKKTLTALQLLGADVADFGEVDVTDLSFIKQVMVGKRVLAW